MKPARGALLDPTHPLAAGLVGAWLLNDGAGPAWNYAAASNPGALVGNAAWVAGTRGTAINCPGNANASYVDCGAIPALNGASRVSLFVAGNLPSSTQAITVGRRVTSSKQFGPGNGGSTIFFQCDDGTNSNFPSAAIPAFGDCTIAMVFDGTQVNTARVAGYWNGQSLTLPTGGFVYPTALPTVSDPFRFSYNQGGTGGARYDLCYLWIGRALSAAEVLRLHSDPYQLFRAGPDPAWFPRALTFRPWIFGDQIEANGLG